MFLFVCWSDVFPGGILGFNRRQLAIVLNFTELKNTFLT